MSTVAPPTDRLWSAEETARYLGVPVSTLYYWRSERNGPPSRRIGRYLRYRAEDVEEWVRGLDGWTVP